MEETLSIEGTLLMLDDKTPHVAVVVQAIRGGKPVATVLSDEGGEYRLTNLEPGRYQLRCQVLGGYVYYRATDHALRFTLYDSQVTESATGEDAGDILQVAHGKPLKNINFRFAPFRKGAWKTYNYLDGLVADYVFTVCRDPDGMMWFGTTGGVSRYDGKEFVKFTTKHGLAHNFVWAIHSDPDGTVWFGTGGGGVSRYDGKEFVNFTTESGLAGNRVYAIYRDQDGVMWFGTHGGGVSRYDAKEFVNFTTEDGLASNTIRAIYRDPDGVMWFATEGGGVSRYDGKEFVSFTTEDGLAHNYVSAIHRVPDGVMWFATGSWKDEGSICRYDGEEFVNFTTEDGLVDNHVHTIHRDPDGVMWFGTWVRPGQGGGVSRYDGKTFVNFTTEDGLALAIHRDPDGVMWFGTCGLGVCRYDPNGFVNFTTKDGLAGNLVMAIHCDPDGVMWFGTWGGVSRYDGKEFVNLTTEDGLVSDVVMAIYRDPDGVMWFATGDRPSGRGAGGISRYDGEEFVNFTTKDGLATNYVHAIHRDPDGLMWFGTWRSGGTGGVSRYDGKEFVNFTTIDGLVHNSVNAIHRDPDGVMWFATGDWFSGGGIFRYDGKEFVNLTTKDGLAHNRVTAIHQDPDGVMWFGTEGGVSRYDGQGFANLTTEDGLAHDFVNTIYRDLNGVMWFGTEGGVSGYDGAAWTSLDTRDGLAGHSVISVLQDPDGFLWFGTEEGGITRYRRSTTPPRVYIVSVTTDQTYRDLSAIPAFTPGTRVTIEYNSIDFKTLPEKRQYRCRIVKIPPDPPLEGGGNSDWRKPTKATSSDFIFDELGTYTFEVQAIDRDLNYSEPASVKLEVIPDPRNHRIIQLEEHIRQQELAELERVHQELEDARQIQQSLLPESPPEIEGFDMAGTSLPAKEVSGDFYNYLPLGDNVGIVLADVTGKSVKAAMVAAMTNGMLQAEVKGQRELWNSPKGILCELNIGLQPHLIRSMYTAMSLGIIRADEKRLLFSNAGMPYPIVKRGREVWELEVSGLPLGIADRAEYEELSTDLEAGDFVVFHSDGVIEATDETGGMYETERLLEVVQQADSDLSAQGLVDWVVKDVAAFVGDVDPSDDITIVVLRYID